MAGTVSSAGVGSGLDVSSIVDSLMKVEQIPLAKLQTVATTMQTKLSAFGQMQSLASSFRDAAAQLQNPSSYAVTTATSSDATAVGASSTTKAVPGSYAVSVTALASTQSTVSASGQFTAPTDVVGTGSITIRLGSWSAGEAAFTPKTGSADFVIPIGATENTLTAIRDKINAANAGVSATIVTDSTGARLALQSAATGAANGFRVSVTDDDATNTDATGLSRLAFDPPSATAGQVITQAAANTRASINGIAVETTGSTLSDVVDGMTFNLSKVTTGPVSVSVTRNTDAVKSLVTGFVASYNALASFLSTATQYDASTRKSALLQGDATTTSLQNQLRAITGQPGKASTVFGTLSDIGLEFQRDGRLKVNDIKLNAAVSKLPELAAAMSNVELGDASKNGFAKKITAWADSLLSTDGTLTGKSKSIQSQISANTKDQEKMTDRISAIEKRIRAQYTALDKTMSNANALSKYVTQQITTWNKNTA